ncbi:TonB-dependent receptor domain-containing protein [Paralimibaculum aggregatum]|nr:TonB-dependent receptor [Limibaculum sp. NKW23]
MSRIAAPTALACAVSMAQGMARAQSVETFELNPIVIESLAGDGVTLTDEDLLRLDPVDLQDLFRTEPTITVGSSIPASQKLYVNGIEETNLAVTIDGARQNNKIFHHNATTLIDPELLKAVRIDPGVAPADAGPGALAGSILFETKDAADLLAPGDDFGGYLSGEYSTNGDVFATSVSLFGRAEGFEGLAYFKHAGGNAMQDGDGQTIIGSGTSLLSGIGKLAYQSDEGYRVEISYERVNDDEARPYRANIGQIIGGRPVPLTRPYALDRENIVLSFEDATPEGLWNPLLVVAHSATDLDIVEDEQRSFGSTRSFNGKLANQSILAFGTLDAGLDFYADRAELDYRYLPAPEFNEGGTETARNIGAFAQARLAPLDRLDISFGGRVDYQRFEGIEGSVSRNAGVSGNLSGSYEILDGLTASAGASRVWGGVELAENFLINPAWVYPDGDLRPAVSNNLFAGLHYDFGPLVPALEGAFVKAKLFRTEIDDARDEEYRGGPALYRDVLSQGIELGAGYSWGPGFVRVGYANIETEIDGRPADSDLGQYLTTPVGQVVVLEVNHGFADIGLTIGADAEFYLEYDGTYDPYTGQRANPLPAYQVVNAFAAYTPPQFPNVTLRAEVTNLLDEDYASRATYGQEFDGVVPLDEPGRAFRISATIRF